VRGPSRRSKRGWKQGTGDIRRRGPAGGESRCRVGQQVTTRPGWPSFTVQIEPGHNVVERKDREVLDDQDPEVRSAHRRTSHLGQRLPRTGPARAGGLALLNQLGMRFVHPLDDSSARLRAEYPGTLAGPNTTPRSES